MKKMALAGLVLILVTVGVLYYITNSLNRWVENALEHYGSAATQTDVRIGSVNIALRSGKGTVSDIAVGNPKSYVAAKAITVGDVTLQLDTASIASKGPLIIKELTVTKPYIIYEVGANGASNLQQLQKNVQSNTSKNTSKTTKTSRKVIIQNLYVRDGKVAVTHGLLKGKEVKTDLPLIHLRNIGQEGQGATPQELTRQILNQISAKAIQAGGRAVTKEIGGIDTTKLNDTLKGLFKK